MGCKQSRDIVPHFTKIAPQLDNTPPSGNQPQLLEKERDKGHLTPSKSTLTPLNPQKQLQHAMEILPNFKAHWEILIEEINVVSTIGNKIYYKTEILRSKISQCSTAK